MLSGLNVLATTQAALGSQWAGFEKQLREELSQSGGSLRIESGGGALVFGDVSTGGGKFVGRDDHSTTITGPVTIVQAPPGSKPVLLPQALRRYLDNLIDMHQHLRLRGIRAGGQPLSVALEAGRAVVLLDGMDEVAETRLRQRVARPDRKSCPSRR